MQRTEIAWTDRSWNPVRGCSRVSEGCRHCYAERMAARFSKPGMWGDGFARRGVVAISTTGTAGERYTRWTGKVELVPEKLDEPLRLRKPQRIFVNSTSDLFHEALPDEAIDRVFAVMALAEKQTFQVLTKRPARMLQWAATRRRDRCYPGMAVLESDPSACTLTSIRTAWPLPNVWLGVSVEDQLMADERIPLLLQAPAAVRFVSYEPALGPVTFRWAKWDDWSPSPRRAEQLPSVERDGKTVAGSVGHLDGLRMLDLVIVGGESGPGARPCDVAWIRSVVQQCREAGVAAFVKQLGARPISDSDDDRRHCGDMNLPHPFRMILGSAKGGNPAEWPEDLRVREMPR